MCVDITKQYFTMIDDKQDRLIFRSAAYIIYLLSSSMQHPLPFVKAGDKTCIPCPC